MIAIYQFNIAQMREPWESSLWDKWRELVPVIHAQVASAYGYMGHYDGTTTGPGYIAPYPRDPLIMGNLSAWISVKALREFTFGPGSHNALLKHRAKWFAPWPDGVIYNAMWWQEFDGRFDLEHAKEQLAKLQAHGNSREVFDWSGTRYG